jgi:uncharacterized protein (DUF488 family)
MLPTIWTIGHSILPVEALVDALLTAGVQSLVDVRRYPQSRRHPQFNRDRLSATLREAGIEYEHAEALGGRRSPVADSPNLGLRDAGFRGFADYMQTPEFAAALDALLEPAQTVRTAVMCAEALPWRCHRSLIADAILARGVRAVHLVGGGEREHELTTVARVEGQRVTYPALL